MCTRGTAVAQNVARLCDGQLIHLYSKDQFKSHVLLAVLRPQMRQPRHLLFPEAFVCHSSGSISIYMLFARQSTCLIAANNQLAVNRNIT